MIADSLTKHVAIWRIAEALRAEAANKPVPTVSAEAPERFAPWDDVVEEWSDGSRHVWQVKSGASITKTDLKSLLVGLRDDLPEASATLATSVNVRVPGIAGDLHVLERLLRAVQNGAAFPTLHDAWAMFLIEACGSSEAAKQVANRLSVQCVGGADGVLSRAVAALEFVYSTERVDDVLNAISTAVDATTGHAVAIPHLRTGPLARFEESRLNASETSSTITARAQYLQTLQSAVDARRVLRQLNHSERHLRDVWIAPRLSLADSDPFELVDLPAHLLEGGAHAVVAPAGGGKTELLARLAAELAQTAAQASDAAIPLVLSLRDLMGIDDASVLHAADKFSIGIKESLAKVLTKPGMRWVLLLDGVDEVKFGAEVVDALRERFPHATSVTTSRPSAAGSMPHAHAFCLERWRQNEVAQFLQQLSAVYEDTAPNVCRLSGYASSLLEIPLTATLAAVVSAQGGSVPMNRTHLFRAATELLVQTWANARRVESPWKTIAPSVRKLALDLVKSERATIDARELERLLRRCAPDDSLLVRHALEQDIGILLKTVDGYEFLVRGMAEYLAAEHLSKNPAELLEACAKPWAQETVRHALVLLADRDAASFGPLIRTLALGDVGTAAGLRGLLAAIYACADLTDGTTEVDQEVARACLDGLRNEASPWRADRVSEAARELAQRNGRCWKLLRELIQPLLSDSRTPAEYFAAQPISSNDDSAAMLFHCDSSVRTEGIRRLAPAATEAFDLLFLMLHDVPQVPCWDLSPALQAGLVLRRVKRGGALAHRMVTLRRLTETGGQLLSAAAASALLPAEHDCATLARAYRRGADGNYVPAHLLREFAEHPEALEALEAIWPEWRGYQGPQQGLRPASASPPEPASDRTRERLVRVLGSEPLAAAHVAPELLQGPGRLRYLEALCERAVAEPEVLVPILSFPPPLFPAFSYRASRFVANAAIRHRPVRAQLIELWAQFQQHPLAWARFPGRVLESLIVGGDPEAASIYATWLPSAPHLSGMYEEPRPEPEVFAPLSIRSAAEEFLAGVVARATVGVTSNGQNLVVSAMSAAKVFRSLASIWRGDAIVTGTVVAWLQDDHSDKRVAALMALDGARLTESESALALNALKTFFRSTDPSDRYLRLPSLVPYIERLGLGASLQEDLTAMANSNSPIAIQAAAALLSMLPATERRALSVSASYKSIDGMSFDGMDRSSLVDLIALAPDSWSAAAIRWTTEASPLNLALSLPILEALPLREQREVAQQLDKLVGGAWSLPWCTNWRSQDVHRPRDLVDRLLFDAGAC